MAQLSTYPTRTLAKVAGVDAIGNVGLAAYGGVSIGGAVSSGTAGSVLFIDASGNLGQDNANFFWDDTNDVLTVGSGASVVTANNPVLSGAQTWNNAGVNFTGIKLNITPTAFGSGSLLQDWQVNSSSLVSLSKAGVFTLPTEIDFSGASAILKVAGTTRLDYGSTVSGKFTTGAPFGVGSAASSTIAAANQLLIQNWIGSGSAGPQLIFNSLDNGYMGIGPATTVANDCRYWFGQTTAPNTAWDTSTTAGHLGHLELFNGSLGLGSAGTVDVYLTRDAANQLALRNTFSLTSAQTLNVYNTYTSSTSYEVGIFDWQSSSNVLTIGTNQGSGGGSARNLRLFIGGSSKFDYGITNSAKWTTLTSFVIGHAGNTIANIQQLIVDAPVSSGSTGPTFLFNANNVNGYFGAGPASASGSDCRFWFGQTTAPNTAWDTSTSAGHLGHFEVFNGSLGLGSGGTVDAYIARSASGVIAFGTTSAADSGAVFLAKTKAGAFTTSDVPAGTWVLGRDTSGATTKMYYNNAGALQVVALV